MQLISIVLPFYNEESNVAPFLGMLLPVLDSVPECRFELLCINDGSRDGTIAALQAARRDESRIVLVDFTRNFGKEAALTAGLDLAEGDAVIFMDTDLQHPPGMISEMIGKWRSGALMVVARRRSRGTESLLYKLLADSFYRIHNRISDITIPPNIGDFRLIDREVAETMKRLPESRRFMKGLFAWAGYDAQVVDYDVAPRASGRTSFNTWKSWNLALEGITSFSTVPLRLWTYIGLLFATLGLCYAVWIIVRTLIHGVDTPGYVTLVTAVVFFGGLQLVGIGVLGEYIGRIYLESKHRPVYLIKKITR